MKIDTAFILCAGLGKRLNPITLKTPKPLLKLKNLTILERCINLNIELGVKKIFINTFYLKDQITNFLKENKFPIDIHLVEDGKEILDTGGGILNMMGKSQENNFLIFNPDTLWNKNYADEINKMADFYSSNRLSNILMVVNKKLSFDKKILGDFELKDNCLKKNNNRNFIYIGCQILNKNLFNGLELKNFPISKIWNDLLKKSQLNGFESLNEFYHLTNLETFKKLEDF